MAITTIAGAIAGMLRPDDFVKVGPGGNVAGRLTSMFYQAGMPSAAALPIVGIGGTALTAYPGQLPFSNPAVGNAYLARLQAQPSVTGTGVMGTLLLCDRLWHNNAIDFTSVAEQAFTGSAQIPARDMNGANLGPGVFAGLEVHVATGTVAPTNITYKYTNQDGVTGKTADWVVVASAVSHPTGAFFPLGLAAGDTGVRLAESITLASTWTSGSGGLVLYRVLARMELEGNKTNAIDALTSGFVRVYDNTVPFLVYLANATSVAGFNGHVIWSHG